MKPTAETIWDRLSFKVIIERGQIAPAFVAADLDHARAEHDSKSESAKKPDHNQRWRATIERPSIEERTEENREEPCFEQLRFPAVAVPVLSEVNERHVKDPE